MIQHSAITRTTRAQIGGIEKSNWDERILETKRTADHIVTTDI